MNRRQALRSAATSIGVRSIRPVRGLAVVTALGFVAIALEMAVITWFGTGSGWVGTLTLFAGLAVIYRWSILGVRRHNAAVGAMLRGQLDEANAELAAMVGSFALRSTVEWAMVNLAEIAMWRGEFATAVTRLRGAEALSSPRVAHHAGVCSRLALALACAGDDPAAEALLAAADLEGAPVDVVARARVTRALLAFRAGRFADAVATLQEGRSVLRSVALGPFIPALSEAIEGSALAGGGQSGYRDSVRALTGLPHSALTRAAVGRVVRGAETTLTHHDVAIGA